MNTVFIDSGSALLPAPIDYDEPGRPRPCPEGCDLDYGDSPANHPSCKTCEGSGKVLLCIGCREPVPQQHLPVCAACRYDDDISGEDSILVLDAIAEERDFLGPDEDACGDWTEVFDD